MFDVTQIIEDCTVSISRSGIPDIMILTIRDNRMGSAWCGNFPTTQFDKLMTYIHIARVIDDRHEMTDEEYDVYVSAFKMLGGDLNSLLAEIPSDFSLALKNYATS